MRTDPRPVFAALLLAATLAPTAAPGADPFYLRLMEEGVRAHGRGDHPTAARRLRIACFGLLDEPDLLTPCLVRLGLAQAAAGDDEGFVRTFRRVVEVEEQLAGYSRAPIPPAERATFERQLGVRIAAAELRSSPLFAAVADDIEIAELQRLGPKRRRQELESRAAAEPASAHWPIELARLEAEAGRERRALPWLDRALQIEPGNPEARCLRAVASAGLGDCPTAVAESDACSPPRLGPAAAGRLLGCQVEQGAWDAARSLLDGLPAPIRAARSVARLAPRVDLERAPVREAPGGSAEPATPIAAAGSEPPPAAPPADRKAAEGRAAAAGPSLPEELRVRMARIRGLLARAQRPGDLGEATALAGALADERPDLVEPQLLAAEAAYLASRWESAVSYFDRAGELGPERADLLFYQAVALFETGDGERAARALGRALERLERTPFVDAYAERILGAGR